MRLATRFRTCARTSCLLGPFSDPSRTLPGTFTRRPDIKTDLRSGFHAQWEAYQAVNGHFAAAVARVARPNDLVWVHWLHRRCGRLFTAAAVNRSGCTTTT